MMSGIWALEIAELRGKRYKCRRMWTYFGGKQGAIKRARLSVKESPYNSEAIEITSGDCKVFLMTDAQGIQRIVVLRPT